MRCKDHGWMREKLELIKSSIQKKETQNPPPSSKFGEHVHLFNVATDSLALRMSSRCEITKKLNTWHLNFFGCCQDEYFSLQRHFSCTLYISNSECILRPPLHRSRNFSLSLCRSSDVVAPGSHWNISVFIRPLKISETWSLQVLAKCFRTNLWLLYFGTERKLRCMEFAVLCAFADAHQQMIRDETYGGEEGKWWNAKINSS